MNRLRERFGIGPAYRSKAPDQAADAQAQKAKAEQAAILRPPMGFHHRPIWDSVANVVISYLCQIAAPVKFPEGSLSPELDGPEGRQAIIDQAVLEQCLATIHSVQQRGFRLVSGVSVALDTISYSRFWRRYSDELQKTPRGICRDLIFFVHKIDSGVPNTRLMQDLPKVTPYGRSIFCLLGEQAYVGSRFSRTEAHAIGIELTPGSSETVAMARIAELARQAAGARLGAFVLGVSTTSLLLHAISQGVRYIEGPIIHPPVSEPRHAFAQSLEHVYISH